MNHRNKLQVILFALIALAALTLTLGAHDARADAPTSPTADQIATRVQAFYDGTRTYRARFEQVYHVRAHDTKKRSTGTVVFQRPGKMAWTYDEPNGNRVVSDGTILKVYERDNKQMVEQPLGVSQYPAVLSFLVGKGELQKTFHLRRLDEKQMKFEGGYVLEGTPRTASAAYTKVIMYIDANTSQVRRMLVIDAQRNRNMFTFSSPAVNVPVTSATFTFNAPPGTQIMRR